MPPESTTDRTTLATHRLFAPLTAAERDRVLRLFDEVALPAGTLLTQHGDPAPGLHLLLEGHVEVIVWVDGLPHDVAVLGPGSWVGEVALLEQQERSSADVRALTDVVAAFVPPTAAAELLAVDAVALQLDALSRRRRATNRALRVPPVEAGSVDGVPLGLRPLWPEDWRQFAANRGRVSEESLRMRFFNVPPLTERMFRHWTATDHGDQFAWGAFLSGDLVGVGRHALQVEDRGVAEVAVLVGDEYHGHGIGHRLITAVVAAADAHGAHDLYALARADNTAVHRLLRRFGAVWRFAADPSTMECRWPVADALASIEDQVLLAGAHAVAAAVLGDVLDP